MSELPQTGLWYPGQPLTETIRQPGPEEFVLHFASTVWNGNFEPGHDFMMLDGSLSALRTPREVPTAIAILDLDDMTGNLGLSLRNLMYPEDPSQPEYFNHDYGEGMFFSDTDTDIKHPLIRMVKNFGEQPVRGIETIRDMVQAWRSAGVYVAFITSALDGAEMSHLDFIAEHFNEACDGIIITSGHYLLADKGVAAQRLVDFTQVGSGTPVVHLDDISHNTSKVRTALEAHQSGVQVASFQHAFKTGRHIGLDEGAEHGCTPLDTFERANSYLEAKLRRRLFMSWDQLKRTVIASPEE